MHKSDLLKHQRTCILCFKNSLLHQQQKRFVKRFLKSFVKSFMKRLMKSFVKSFSKCFLKRFVKRLAANRKLFERLQITEEQIV